MAKLPLLPGYTIQDPNIKDYRLLQKFRFLNGYRIVRDSTAGIGGRPIDAVSTAHIKEEDIVSYDPSLTYGRVKEYAYPQVIPPYALFAQKCLCFKAFFRQGVFNSPDEHFRIRHVNILYFLEDDTVCVIEPTTPNAGFKQGKLVRRCKIPKNVSGNTFHWKDFNLGIDLNIFGVVYHTTDCDLFTREFLESQGIDVGDKEEPPVDPYTEIRASKGRTQKCVERSSDTRRRFLEYDKMVLSFTATWNDDVYRIMYFLTDDTIAIYEIQKPNSGKDPVPTLLKRMKVPKDWKNFPVTYPAIYLEYSDPEISEYYAPKDFIISDTIFIFNRRFFLHDCDRFTRKYYSNVLGIVQPDEIPLPTKEIKAVPVFKPPPRTIFGSPEDTYASCLSFIPKPPKKDVVRLLHNFPKKLRYAMRMDAVHLEDMDRDFILEYNLYDGTIVILELKKEDSGRREGCFLKATPVPKPKTDNDNPEYYTPQDFYIGAMINVFNHYFIIVNVDLFVYRYIEANPEKFPREVRDNIRNHLVKQNLLSDDIDVEMKTVQNEEDAKLEALKPAVGTSHKNIEIAQCVQDLETQTKCRYEGEYGELRPRTPPPEDLCPALQKGKSVPLPLLLQDPKTFAQKKEVKWDDRVK